MRNTKVQPICCVLTLCTFKLHFFFLILFFKLLDGVFEMNLLMNATDVLLSELKTMVKIFKHFPNSLLTNIS